MCLLAHLSRWLTGELIGKLGLCVVCHPHSLITFSSETAWPIKIKFHMKPPWDGGTEVCSNNPGHMTMMAAMPIYGKNLKNLLFRNRRADDLKLGMQHRMHEYYQVYSNDEPGLTLTYCTARLNLVSYAFVWEKGKTMDFSETIVVYDNKVGRCSYLNEYMKLYEYRR